MWEVITVMAIMIVCQGYWISVLRRELKDMNWKLPAGDKYRGEIFNGKT